MGIFLDKKLVRVGLQETNNFFRPWHQLGSGGSSRPTRHQADTLPTKYLRVDDAQTMHYLHAVNQ